MELASFLVEIARRTTVGRYVGDPMLEATKLIEQHGETHEGRTLRKLIHALATGEGSFDEMEIWRLGPNALAVASSLIQARVAGARYNEAEWSRFCLATGLRDGSVPQDPPVEG